MTKIGTVLLFNEPSQVEEVPYPSRPARVSAEEIERRDHLNRYSPGYETWGYSDQAGDEKH